MVLMLTTPCDTCLLSMFPSNAETKDRKDDRGLTRMCYFIMFKRRLQVSNILSGEHQRREKRWGTDRELIFLCKYLSEKTSPIEDILLDVCRGAPSHYGNHPE